MVSSSIVSSEDWLLISVASEAFTPYRFLMNCGEFAVMARLGKVIMKLEHQLKVETNL